MKVYLANLGCKLNQAELEQMARGFVAAGHEIVRSLDEAEIRIVNSCAVTQTACRSSRKAARRGAGGGLTVLTGCYATAAPKEARALPGVDLVVSNDDKARLVDRVHQALGFARSPLPPELPIPYTRLEPGHARAMVKIGDGCNLRCAFCIIPSTRGRERYRPPGEIIAEVQALADGGYHEVVLTGVQISSYVHGETRLGDLVAALLARTTISRLRLTSIAPWDFDSRLLALFADPRLCRHVHLSLQSGSSATLRRMRRPYTAGAFAGVREALERAVPGLAVTTDVIVGFPGETDEEHHESRAFVEAMRFARVHLFPYSSRPGTAAAGMPDPVSPEVKRQRLAQMQNLAARAERRYAEAHLGRTLEVLWETREGELWQGHAGNYLRVFAPSAEPLRGSLRTARINALAEGGVEGDLV